MSSKSHVFLARQPIYDRRLKVHAYELLYRRDEFSGAGEVGAAESASTLVRAIVEIGLDRLVGKKPAYINIPHYLLDDPSLFLLPKDRVVLEILEDTEPTEVNLKAVSKLADAGYKLALDDFVFGSPLIEFLPFAKIVKVDLLGNTPKQIASCAQLLQASKVRLLAEKVETMSIFAKCQAQGFHYFQGYFCARPEIVAGKTIPSSRALLLNLLNRLQDSSITVDELEKLVSADVALTFRLLRLVNSALLSTPEPVDSIRSALVLLGLQKVSSVVSLLALAGIGDKPSELITTAMIRAKMCENVSGLMAGEDPSRHFTVGLLSVLDSILDIPMADILTQIPIAEDLKDALTNPDAHSPLTVSLQTVLAYESGSWDKVKDLDCGTEELNRCYVESVEWAEAAHECLAA